MKSNKSRAILGTLVLFFFWFTMPIQIYHAASFEPTAIDSQAQQEAIDALAQNNLLESHTETVPTTNSSEKYVENEAIINESESDGAVITATPEEGDSLFEMEDRQYFHQVEQMFSLPEGETLIAEKGKSTTIQVSATLPTQQLRITLPKGAAFASPETELTFEEIEVFENQATAYLVTFPATQTEFHFSVSFTEEGHDQLTVEDAEGIWHTVFLFTYVTNGSRNEIQPSFERSSVNVATWANFRAAWNTNSRTVIVATTNIPSETTSLNTRTSSITLESTNVVSAFTINGNVAPTLSWSDSTSVTIRNIHLDGFVLSGGAMQVWEAQGRVTSRGSSQLTELRILIYGSTVAFANPNFDNQGTLTMNSLYMWQGRMRTATPINVLQTAYLNNSEGSEESYLLWTTAAQGTPLNTRWVEFDYGLAVWHRGSALDISRPDMGWRGLRASIRNNSITTSNMDSFNDTAFQLSNARALGNYNRDNQYPDLSPEPPVDPDPPIDPDPDPDPDPVAPPIDPELIGQSAQIATFYVTETGSRLMTETVSGLVGFHVTIQNSLPGGEFDRRFPEYELVSWTTDPNEGSNPLLSGSFVPETGRYMPYMRQSFLIMYHRLKESTVTVEYVSTDGTKLAPEETITGQINDSYQTQAKEIEGWRLSELPANAQGRFTLDPITVSYVYEPESDEGGSGPLPPVDPLDPDKEVDPEDKPEIPEDQGLLSIDFVSNFRFGQQKISAQDKSYYAQAQRLLDENGNVLENEVRPNYIQISDLREKSGWELSVTQNQQFKNNDGNELKGAEIILHNQEVASVSGYPEPLMINRQRTPLIPGVTIPLMKAFDGREDGQGTWIYRFGNGETADESVELFIPASATPDNHYYQTQFTWQLQAVPAG